MMMMITIDCKLGFFSEIFVGAKSWFQQGSVRAAFKVHLAGNYDADGEDAGGDGDAEHAGAEDDGEEGDAEHTGGEDDGGGDALHLFPNVLDAVDLRTPHPPESLLAAVQSSLLSWHWSSLLL